MLGSKENVQGPSCCDLSLEYVEDFLNVEIWGSLGAGESYPPKIMWQTHLAWPVSFIFWGHRLLLLHWVFAFSQDWSNGRPWGSSHPAQIWARRSQKHISSSWSVLPCTPKEPELCETTFLEPVDRWMTFLLICDWTYTKIFQNTTNKKRLVMIMWVATVYWAFTMFEERCQAPEYVLSRLFLSAGIDPDL